MNPSYKAGSGFL
ncbi:hypothetical protein YPPY36_2903, partial [Yersinia pestis PY-36]